jgi:aspartyl-tRNA(Asn)/glutamyl-tRNA(Gln) amidotransferase subunit A
MTGFDPRDSTSLERDNEDYTGAIWTSPLKGLRIGLPQEFFGRGLATTSPAWTPRSTELKKLGATTVEISLPNAKLAIPVYYVLAPAEASSNLSRFDGVRYGYRAPTTPILDDMYCKTRARASAPRSSGAS